MNYVFFDVECANCINGEGKICSFGYVKTDENFSVLRKKDILIDPVAPFLLGNSQGEGIKLAYPLFRFQRAFTFPHYYKEIQALLEDKENICFGFAVYQDVSYLSYTCKRYGLQPLMFDFYDIQKLEVLLRGKKTPSGLDYLVEEFHLTSYTYHRSDDDALMTMEVYKELLGQYHLSVYESLKQFPQIKNDTDHFLHQFEMRKKQKLLHKQYLEKTAALFSEPLVRFDINLYNPILYHKIFFIDSELLTDEIDFFLKHKKSIDAHGAILTKNPKSAQIVLVKTSQKRLHIPELSRHVVYMDYESFKKELNKKGH